MNRFSGLANIKAPTTLSDNSSVRFNASDLNNLEQPEILRSKHLDTVVDL